jgi:hypothetical protein
MFRVHRSLKMFCLNSHGVYLQIFSVYHKSSNKICCQYLERSCISLAKFLNPLSAPCPLLPTALYINDFHCHINRSLLFTSSSDDSVRYPRFGLFDYHIQDLDLSWSHLVIKLGLVFCCVLYSSSCVSRNVVKEYNFEASRINGMRAYE